MRPSCDTHACRVFPEVDPSQKSVSECSVLKHRRVSAYCRRVVAVGGGVEVVVGGLGYLELSWLTLAGR